MDLYDLFAMEALKGISPSIAYMTNIHNNTQSGEDTLRGTVFSNMHSLRYKNRYKIIFGPSSISQLTVENHKTFVPGAVYFRKVVDTANEFRKTFYPELEKFNESSFKPDILLHQPKSLLHEHIVVEMKVSTNEGDCQKDICKLASYVLSLKYRKAYFIFTKKVSDNQDISKLALKILKELYVVNPEENLVNQIRNRIKIVFPTSINSKNEYIWTCMPYEDVISINWDDH